MSELRRQYKQFVGAVTKIYYANPDASTTIRSTILANLTKQLKTKPKLVTELIRLSVLLNKPLITPLIPANRNVIYPIDANKEVFAINITRLSNAIRSNSLDNLILTIIDFAIAFAIAANSNRSTLTTIYVTDDGSDASVYDGKPLDVALNAYAIAVA